MLDQTVLLPGSALPAEIHNNSPHPFVKGGGDPYAGEAKVQLEHQHITERQAHAHHRDQAHIYRELGIARGPQGVDNHEITGPARFQEEAEQNHLRTHHNNGLIISKKSEQGYAEQNDNSIHNYGDEQCPLHTCKYP
ncbi:hypothetical protein D3C80_1451690 [compost metagenome]